MYKHQEYSKEGNAPNHFQFDAARLEEISSQLKKKILQRIYK